MDRREFSKNALMTLVSVVFLDTLFKRDLFAASVKPLTDYWLKDLHTMCLDLRTEVISQIEWQQKIAAFHRRLPLEDLLQTIDFEKAVASFEYPDLGVITTDPKLPRVEGVSDKYAFAGRIFGMRKDRAVIPHGHKHMVSCHRVLKGEFLLRQYDRLRDEGDSLYIRQTIEETGKPGSFSSVSDEKDNIHWLVAHTERAYTFDVIVSGLDRKPYEIDNIDIYAADKLGNGILKVKKMDVEEALKKYGKTHH